MSRQYHFVHYRLPPGQNISTDATQSPTQDTAAFAMDTIENGECVARDLERSGVDPHLGAAGNLRPFADPDLMDVDMAMADTAMAHSSQLENVAISNTNGVSRQANVSGSTYAAEPRCVAQIPDTVSPTSRVEETYDRANANAIVNAMFHDTSNAMTTTHNPSNVNDPSDAMATTDFPSLPMATTDLPSLPTHSPAANATLPEPLYRAANYVDATPAQKTEAIRRLLEANYFSSKKLRPLTTLHEGMTAQDNFADGKRHKPAAQLKAEFLSHSCTESCLLSLETARASNTPASPMQDHTFMKAAQKLKLRLGLIVRTGEKQVAGATGSTTENGDCKRTEPFCITSEEEKRQIMDEIIEATSNRSLRKLACSFCGSKQRKDDTTAIPCSQLDTTLLDDAVKDPGPLLNILPPPLSDLFDEICVVLVGSKDTQVTASMLENTPLLTQYQSVEMQPNIRNMEYLSQWKASFVHRLLQKGRLTPRKQTTKR
ncbi:hypothetical protein K438DRAFT_1957934 [Mycena galopus ATCC 62051]|nr:hypothetical protein K438DRAFT_1957934 [Mycena galopus ATCC 62051]